MSSPTPQRFTLYQIQCRVQIDTGSGTAFYFGFLASFSYLVATFELRIFEISRKIDLDEAFRIHSNNFDQKELIVNITPLLYPNFCRKMKCLR